MARGRGRGRGRGASRGRRAARVVSSDEEQQQQQQPQEKETTLEGTHKSEESIEKMSEVAGLSEQVPEKMETETSVVESIEEKEVAKKDTDTNETTEMTEIKAPTIDMEADISQLEAPTFTTISRGPPEPMLHLEWNHKVNLIGEKVINPMIHCCDQCEKPILIYGRMIPCKHVFCLGCARKETMKMCPRCKEKAIRVEQTGLGTVFMCTHGGTRYESKGCRRTYLSQRDLQAHINHRHISTPIVPRLESLAVKSNDGTSESSVSTGNVILSPQKKPEARSTNVRSGQTGAAQASSSPNQYFNAPQSSQNRGAQGYFSPFSGYSNSGAETQWNQGQYYR